MMPSVKYIKCVWAMFDTYPKWLRWWPVFRALTGRKAYIYPIWKRMRIRRATNAQ